MSDKSSTSAAGNAASASTTTSVNADASSTANGTSSTAAPKRPAAQGNPAFRMMGLPRFRLPSRNWLIFLSVTGTFASAVIYDKYQTRRVRQKWCDLVSHIADEPLSTHTLPRKMTVYLSAPPGDGLRSAREHFHEYIKPVLVSAAMDWDVIEGRKEGDVRFKTADRIRKTRKKAGEGEPLPQEKADGLLTVDVMREKTGTTAFDGVAGDLIVGRQTWKEYVRGLHEGWLGPVDAPKQTEADASPEMEASTHMPGQSSIGDAAVEAAVDTIAPSSPDSTTPVDSLQPDDQSQDPPPSDEKSSEDKKKEEEMPKHRQPPPYIQPSDYPSAAPSPHLPEIIGPSTAIRFPHILGFRNTPIRFYRFLTRRHLADSIGRDVATAVIASYRPYAASATSFDSVSPSADASDEPEHRQVLAFEERDWWKTTFQPRKEHEESVWIEDMVLDERIAGRMRAFQLMAEDEDRAKRIGEGREKVVEKGEEEG